MKHAYQIVQERRARMERRRAWREFAGDSAGLVALVLFVYGVYVMGAALVQ